MNKATVTVEVNGETQTFTAETTSNGDPYTAADAALDTAWADAGKWIRDQKSTRLLARRRG